jgi:hypothetical protein
VGPVVVVDLGEGVQLRLEVTDGGGGVGGGEPLLHRLVEAFDLPAGLGVVGAGVVQPDVEGGAQLLERDLAAAAWGAGEDRGVVGQHARW